MRRAEVLYPKILDMNESNDQETVSKLKKNLTEVKVDVESFIKEHPLAAAGIAARIGFTLAKIFKGKD